MTQFTIKLDLNKDVKASEIGKLLGKLDGVIKLSISKAKHPVSEEKKELKEWAKNVEWLSNNFDSSDLDMNDELTRHLMSK